MAEYPLWVDWICHTDGYTAVHKHKHGWPYHQMQEPCRTQSLLTPTRPRRESSSCARFSSARSRASSLASCCWVARLSDSCAVSSHTCESHQSGSQSLSLSTVTAWRQPLYLHHTCMKAVAGIGHRKRLHVLGGPGPPTLPPRRVITRAPAWRLLS
jgi:hypothetical protein